jgi:hypothetical protein
MTRSAVAPVAVLTREEQIEALMNQLRPKVEEPLRRMVERPVTEAGLRRLGSRLVGPRFADVDARRVRAGRGGPNPASTQLAAPIARVGLGFFASQVAGDPSTPACCTRSSAC